MNIANSNANSSPDAGQLKGVDFDATTAIRDAVLESSLKLVLFTLASRTNPNTHRWLISQERLALEAGVSRKTVQRKSETLIRMGLMSRELVRDSRYGEVYEYTVNVAEIKKLRQVAAVLKELRAKRTMRHSVQPPCDILSKPCDILSNPCDSVTHTETNTETESETEYEIEVGEAGPSGPAGEELPQEQEKKEEARARKEKWEAAQELVRQYHFQCVGALKPRVKFWFELGRLYFPDGKCFKSGKKLDDRGVRYLNELFAHFGHLACPLIAVAFREWRYPGEVDEVPTSNPDPYYLYELRSNFLAIWADEADRLIAESQVTDLPATAWDIAQQVWDREVRPKKAPYDSDSTMGASEMALVFTKRGYSKKVA